MSAEAYSVGKGGKLKLKGESSKKHKHKKHKRSKDEDASRKDFDKEDELSHGGSWLVGSYEQITGSIVVEFKEQMYMHCLENGVFVLGAPHQPGERADPNEILTAVQIDNKYVAFKSAHGKYVSVNSNGLVIGRSEAISPKEYFEVEFDYDYDGRKTYLKASNQKYVSVSNDGDVVALKEEKEDMSLRIRSLNKSDSNAKAKRELPEEERADDLRNVELNYVKKFQKFQDKRIKLSTEDTKELSEAKEAGILHEKLLDRREKMKADRYCK